MISKDYIMRMVEQFSQVLSKIIFHKKNNDLHEAKSEIRNAYKNILCLDHELVSMINIEELLKLLHFDGKLNEDKCMIVAELLFQGAEIDKKDGNIKSSKLNLQKSLFLLLEIYLGEGTDHKETANSKIKEVIEKINNFEFSEDIKRRLVEYYENEGNYSKAEDYLFELVDSNKNDYIEFGKEFFARLLAKNDEELIMSGLPREELTEGLNELESLEKKHSNS